MKNESRTFFIFGTIILLLVFIEPRLGWTVRDFLIGYSERSSSDLESENLALKAELAKLNDIKDQLSEWSNDYVAASVYSSYPFNIKRELVVNVGKNQGIRGGEAVLFKRFLIGRVEEARDDTSVVRTVFDDRWQSSVRIGSSGVDALLRGGGSPRATLIKKSEEILPGTILYDTTPDFPYALPVGEVGETQLSSDGLFQESSVSLRYDFAEMRNVLILKQHAK
jgi:cell shape-determining protein MreC